MNFSLVIGLDNQSIQYFFACVNKGSYVLIYLSYNFLSCKLFFCLEVSDVPEVRVR